MLRCEMQDAREAGFVNTVVPPGHAVIEARKVTREICALPADAVSISRKLLKLPTEDLVGRIGQEDHFFGERMRSPEAIGFFAPGMVRRPSRCSRVAKNLISCLAMS
jgi:enoyl-CoA hydratase/carnithine racemase